MSFFSRKVRTNAVEFSREFYDRYVYGPDPTGGDFALTYAETTRRLISEADPSFATVSLPELKEELQAHRLEMIGTAWTHESKPQAALAVSEFTKQYLSEIGRSDVWETMTDYNQAVAESAKYGADPESRTGRARIAFVNVTRADLFDAWIAEGHDAEAVARVANRFGSDVSWRAGITQGLLAIRITRRLDIQGSELVWHRLAAVAHGFYQGAKESLDGIRLTA